MLEEEKMQKQKEVDVIVSYNDIPYFILDEELEGNNRNGFIKEMNEIKELYKNYEIGKDFLTEGSNGDYVPSDLRFRKAASMVNKEARFLFANPPTFTVNKNDIDNSNKEENSILQAFLDNVLKKNMFNDKLLKGCKDCFIGKRVAIVLNFSDKGKITITFLSALNFIFEMSDDCDELVSLTTFNNTVDTTNKVEQRWFKKRYIVENEIVYVEENIYNGLGELIENVTPKRKTKFEQIPAVVILNDGLTMDLKGKSEMQYFMDYEQLYSKMSNADVDAERKSMNPIRYAIDASQESTSNLSTSPGSFWDIQSDDTKPLENVKAVVGSLESSMNYSAALGVTLDRIESNMYAMIDMPNVSSEKMQGVITSGKTLKAIYWGLVVRCDEKMLAWRPALETISNLIIEGARLYPNCVPKYLSKEKSLPDIDCLVYVENNYPLPEDEQEEKAMDLAEINANVMSRKSYIKKWRELNDEDVEDELKQIKLEMDLFDNSLSTFQSDESMDKQLENNTDESLEEQTNNQQKEVNEKLESKDITE